MRIMRSTEFYNHSILNDLMEIVVILGLNFYTKITSLKIDTTNPGINGSLGISIMSICNPNEEE